MAGIKAFRSAIDAGTYLRVGELKPSDSAEELTSAFTLRSVLGAAKEALGDDWLK